MTRAPRLRRAGFLLVFVCLAGCAGGPPLYRDRPSSGTPAPREASPEKPRATPVPPLERTREREAERERGGAADGLDPLVRVGIHVDETRVTLSTLRTWTIEADTGAPTTREGDELKVRAIDGAVRIETESGGEVVSSKREIRLAPASGSFVSVDGARHRGTLALSARSDSLFVVVELPLEDYLRGVVPAEVGRLSADLEEAVAAQAIAARTYAAKQMKKDSGFPFDLLASVQDQVYEGFEGEDPVADAAIRATRGLVLTGEHGPIDAYYSSTCGGKRADIEIVWPQKESAPCLRGGADGEGSHAWCRSSPHFEWRESWTGTRLSELARRHLPAEAGIDAAKIGPLTGLEIDRDESTGRIRFVEYRWKGASVRVLGDRNRWILRRPDGSILRSVFVKLDVERKGGLVTRVLAHGGGNGHGVGMCQIGAIARARAGQDVFTILEGYYPGARVRPLSEADLPARKRARGAPPLGE